MNAMNLSALLCLSLSLIAPAAVAQTDLPHNWTTVKVVKVQKADVQPIEEEGDETVVKAKTAAPEEEVLDLRIDARKLEGGGICLDVRQSDGAKGHLLLAFFMRLDGGELLPIALLDADMPDMRCFALALDVFANLPIAIMALRVDSDGVAEAGPLEKAAEIAGRAGQ